MSATRAYELFEELQREVSWNYKQVYGGSRYSTNNTTFQAEIYPGSLTLVWLIYLVLITSQSLNSPNILNRTPGVVFNYFFFSIFLGFSGLIVASLYRLYKKEAKPASRFIKDETLYFLLFVFLVPVGLSFSVYFATIALGSPVVDADLPRFILGSAMGLNVGAFTLNYLFVTFILPFLPVILVSIIIEDLANTSSANDLSYDALIRNTVNKSYAFVIHYSPRSIRTILSIAERKHTSLSAHVQTLSPTIGSFGLFGLFALAVTQDQIQSIIVILEDYIFRLLLVDIHGFLGIIAITLVFLLVLLSSVYFYRVYFALRVLEILIVLCEMRLVNIAQGEYLKENEEILAKLLKNRVV